jgi:parvulin-like peptidyl-prolyl isomerase
LAPPLSLADGTREIAATIDKDFVFVSEVERELSRVINDRPIEPLAKRVLQAQTLRQLVDRRLIVHWLQSKGQGASKAELDLSVQRLEKRLAQRDKTLAKHLAELDTTEEELRRLFEWQIGWQRFTARYMTDENIQKYFDQHRQDFDGTKMHVAHILFKIEGDDPQPALEKAKELRRRIAAEKLTFQAAAMSSSAAPTAAKGGDIGLISRRAPMPESFSKAAFALAVGEVSEPVVTAFGVHLIRCLKIEPGQNRWQDVREELSDAITLYLFTWAADRQRVDARIKFTGAIAHFRPGTEELAD